MNDGKFLNQTEHISDIFTKIMLKVTTADLAESGADEITPAQFQALKHIALHGSCSIGGLAEGLCVSQPAATMLVDRVARKGLAERRPAFSDRRQAEVSLTAAGRELLRRVESNRSARLAKILKRMKECERERFIESLECFIAAALKLECRPGEVCMRCGTDHQDDCIVNQTHLELAGRQIEKT